MFLLTSVCACVTFPTAEPPLPLGSSDFLEEEEEERQALLLLHRLQDLKVIAHFSKLFFGVPLPQCCGTM